MQVFLDDHGEQSFKKCVDVYELAARLSDKEHGGLGMDLGPELAEDLGAVLLCFGEIEHDLRYGYRVPAETVEEKKQRLRAEMKAAELEEARKEAAANGT